MPGIDAYSVLMSPRLYAPFRVLESGTKRKRYVIEANIYELFPRKYRKAHTCAWNCAHSSDDGLLGKPLLLAHSNNMLCS